MNGQDSNNNQLNQNNNGTQDNSTVLGSVNIGTTLGSMPEVPVGEVPVPPAPMPSVPPVEAVLNNNDGNGTNNLTENNIPEVPNDVPPVNPVNPTPVVDGGIPSVESSVSLNNGVVNDGGVPSDVPPAINENNNEVGTVNLGTVDQNAMNTPEVAPVSTETPVENDANGEPIVVNPAGEVVNPTPVAQPIPGTMASNSNQSGLDPVVQGNSNGFVEPNKIESPGMVPPQQKEKKQMSKGLFILLVIGLIVLVAFGVYTLLSKSKDKISVNVKSDITISVGDVVSTNPADYATISGTQPTNCKVDVSRVDETKAGQYEFIVTCGNNKKEYRGQVIVEDNSTPIVGMNIVYSTVDGLVSVDDFIASCESNSGCSYDFVNEADVNNYLINAGGPYTVGINIRDDANHESVVESDLYVVPYDIRFFSYCSSAPEELTEYKATKVTSDRLAFGSDNTSIIYLNAGRREFTYVFSSKEDYEKAIGDKPSKISFDGNTGIATYNDDDMTLGISIDLDNSLLNDAGEVPKDFAGVRNHYMNNKKYTCETIRQ